MFLGFIFGYDLPEEIIVMLIKAKQMDQRSTCTAFLVTLCQFSGNSAV